VSSVKNTKPYRLWREYRTPLLFLGLMLCFRSAWADWVTVPTGSMNPTVLEGDRLLINKHVFGLRIPFTLTHLTAGEDPARGDIVVFDSPADGTSLVKRVVGLPGDVVEMDGEALIVNNQRAQYAEGTPGDLRGILEATAAQDPVVLREMGLAKDHDVMILPRRASRRYMGPLTVPEGQYFMLGDNRDNSGDSRYFGFVPRRNIVGRATRVVVSLNPDRHYAPRGERFLTPLH
jgi:signal peptidase I